MVDIAIEGFGDAPEEPMFLCGGRGDFRERRAGHMLVRQTRFVALRRRPGSDGISAFSTGFDQRLGGLPLLPRAPVDVGHAIFKLRAQFTLSELRISWPASVSGPRCI